MTERRNAKRPVLAVCRPSRTFWPGRLNVRIEVGVDVEFGDLGQSSPSRRLFGGYEASSSMREKTVTHPIALVLLLYLRLEDGESEGHRRSMSYRNRGAEE